MALVIATGMLWQYPPHSVLAQALMLDQAMALSWPTLSKWLSVAICLLVSSQRYANHSRVYAVMTIFDRSVSVIANTIFDKRVLRSNCQLSIKGQIQSRTLGTKLYSGPHMSNSI
ncbi:hypothetical protein CXF83_03320 [Shewanella sp. Choline-02u-19]|uniref:hypothetical protein n=1 Tax=unclassified Shewanella TaxID=196818 RepID=UPI000C33B09F|nr:MULTISPECIES: hypothetical protein [unclassified Shewanella]PKG72761.1 hypothetical protein CXF86_20350 [Shewanella sp. GutCb]PKH57188.1 hypothetical protein CXF84_09435 [Shewanella sp. Bg11-22]PKI29697.1 hypothetical protein CXF83_03320 [Shewanella sp. Choline-02u-19]